MGAWPAFKSAGRRRVQVGNSVHGSCGSGLLGILKHVFMSVTIDKNRLRWVCTDSYTSTDH